VSEDEAATDLAMSADLCSSDVHGHHLGKEKAVTAKTFTLRPMTNPVNVFKSDVARSEETVAPLT